MADIGNMFGADGVDTFMGVPRCDDPGTPGASAVLLGAPCATPYPAVGAYCADAPAAIRRVAASYAANRSHVNFDLGREALPDGALVDCGDLAFDTEDAAGNRERIQEAVARVLAGGAVPVVLGGDDSIPIPMLRAHDVHGPLTVVQIDAHIDWRDSVGGERQGLSSTMRRASEMDHVERIVQVGARGIGSARPDDWQAARAWGVHFVTAEQVTREGIAPVLEQLPEGGPVVVMLDCDALDPSIMPAVIGRTPGGLGYWDVLGLIRGVARRGHMVGFSMVEFMPSQDVDGLGAGLAAQLLTSTCGIIHASR
jgi:agmatinase